MTSRLPDNSLSANQGVSTLTPLVWTQVGSISALHRYTNLDWPDRHREQEGYGYD
jgi:DNA primase